jgi:phosphatidylglycerol:prolipoprotein diacylglycerol transferase
MKPGIAYSAVMVAALVVGGIVARHTWDFGPPLSRLQRLSLLMGALIGGVLAAKLPYLFGDFEALRSGRAWLESGRTLTLGLVGGYFGVELAKVIAGVRAKTGDGFVVPLAVTVGLGRLGCLVGGCCFGVETDVPWALPLFDGAPRHPTQIYEALFHLAAALAFHRFGLRGVLRAQRIKAYFLAYFVFRFATEWLRPEPRLALGLTFYQWVCLLATPLFVALWWHDARGRRPSTSSA